MKPIAKTSSCQAPHTQYIVSGRIKVVMNDGTEEECGPGDAAVIPPGHNAWVVGNEPVVAIDFTGSKRIRKELKQLPRPSFFDKLNELSIGNID